MGEFDNEFERGLDSGSHALADPSTKTDKPTQYQVVLLNDDFTPMDFVIRVLQKFFHKDEAEATRLMMDVHKKGVGVAGIYTFDIAETKAYQVNAFSAKNRHPLKCEMREV